MSQEITINPWPRFNIMAKAEKPTDIFLAPDVIGMTNLCRADASRIINRLQRENPTVTFWLVEIFETEQAAREFVNAQILPASLALSPKT